MVDVVTVHIASIKARIGGSDGADFKVSNKNDTEKFYFHTGTVDGGGGSDTLSFYGICNVTVFGGSGDDRIDMRELRSESEVVVDGGKGTDVLDLRAATSSREFVDWSNVQGIEWIRLWLSAGRAAFTATDEMFAGIGRLRIVGVSQNGHGRFTIDGSAVSVDGLNLYGLEGGINEFIGGSRDDLLVGRNRNDTLEGGAGDDVLFGDDGRDDATFSGNMSNYSIVYDYAAHKVTVTDNVGDDGTDTLEKIERIKFADQTYVVLDQGKTRHGTAGEDILKGGTGNDLLDGRGNADRLLGDYGNDSLIGGAGNDKIFGDSGDDTIDGGAGKDHIDAGKGSDAVLGGADKDSIEDRAEALEHSTIDGGSGNDLIRIFGGIVFVEGGSGNDRIGGYRVVGTIDGGVGDDTIRFYHPQSEDIANPSLLAIGGEGNDEFAGELWAGVTVLGGNGDDIVTAEHWASGYTIDLGDGTDVVETRQYVSWYERTLVLDWADIHNAEVVAVRSDSSLNGNDDWQVVLNDDMFVNQDRWVVSAEPEKPYSAERLEIDASAITAGHLEIIGRSLNIDTLIGGAMDDTLRGLSGDDFLIGGDGDDLLDGGGGYDFVVYDGKFADYTIEKKDGKVIVTALDSDDGVDTLIDVEVIRFDDNLLAL